MRRPPRVLVVTDTGATAPELVAAVVERAAQGPARFRLVVLNPARAELHLLHPERHDRAEEAELALMLALPELESAAGQQVLGSVSIRHDPVDAVEEAVHTSPVDEILLHVHPGALARRFHHDLPRRLAHLGIPVHTVERTPAR